MNHLSCRILGPNPMTLFATFRHGPPCTRCWRAPPKIDSNSRPVLEVWARKVLTTFGLQRIQIFKRSYTYSLPNSLQQNKSSYNSEFSSFCIVESMNGSFATIQNDDGRTWDTPGHYKSKDGASKWRAFHGENEMNWFYRKFVLKNSICS